MRAFVTGATGFIGSHLVDALLSHRSEVVCLARDPGKIARLFPNAAPHTVRGTLFDDAALRAGCDGADVVFHVAGITAARNRDEFLRLNGEGTRRVLAAAAAAAPSLTRFVYVSSLSAAGPATRGHPMTEADPPRPVSAYGASKLAGEDATRASALPWTIIRPPAVYGPRDVEFARLFRLVRYGLAAVFRAGEQQLSLVHVRDLVRALRLAVEAAPPSTTFFASQREIVTQRQLVGRIYRAVRRAVRGHADPLATPLTLPLPASMARIALAATYAAARVAGTRTLLSPDKGREFLAEAWTCSAAALERDTGWQATIGLDEGLAETAAWYREHGWL